MTSKPLINKNHIQYLEGSLPIIFSAPHGGSYTPYDIQDRTSGVFDKDDYTKELTLAIRKELFAQTRCYPYAIIMNLSRIKVDVNREEYEAVSNDEQSIDSYRSFHNFVKNAKNDVARKFEKGIYIDIHGQSHPHKAIEFGYLLTNDILRLEDKEISTHQGISSIKTLSDFSSYSFCEQIKGEFSLGTLMAKKGFDSIPSSNMPYALDDKEYFEGAYNTKTYASTDGSPVSAIQVEFPYHCRVNKENRKKVAKAFVSSLLEFMKVHFDTDLKKRN